MMDPNRRMFLKASRRGGRGHWCTTGPGGRACPLRWTPIGDLSGRQAGCAVALAALRQRGEAGTEPADRQRTVSTRSCPCSRRSGTTTRSRRS